MKKSEIKTNARSNRSRDQITTSYVVAYCYPAPPSHSRADWFCCVVGGGGGGGEQKDCKSSLADCVSAYTRELATIRSGGRATAEQLQGIMVKAYGTLTPIAAVGTIASRSAQVLVVCSIMWFDDA